MALGLHAAAHHAEAQKRRAGGPPCGVGSTEGGVMDTRPTINTMSAKTAAASSPSSGSPSSGAVSTDAHANGSADARARETLSPVARALDDAVMAMLARQTGGLSPLAFATAGFDWATHMMTAPGRRMDLYADYAGIMQRAALGLWLSPMLLTSAAKAEAEGKTPLAVLYDAFDALEAWIDKAVDAAPGVSLRHREMMRFAARQQLEPLRPENYLLTNPDAIRRTMREGGANLVRGWTNWMRDFGRYFGRETGTERLNGEFRVGETLAATEGSVVYRNHLIELIQYKPTTEDIHATPVLITPAWIMKYYILDLSAHNSLVRYLTEQGYTVFMISWRNPNGEDGALSFDDYRTQGVLSALDAVSALVPGEPIHAVGYCLGGTLLSIAAAALARDGDDRLASLTLLAAQTDFRDPGELSIFIDECQLDLLDASMDVKGYLDAEQMSAAFMMLRSRDLVWRRYQRAYLYGETEQMFDLVAWNADATRMPYRMHSEYLRRLFLNNDFVQGRFDVDGRPVAVSDIRAPIFALGTEKDHIAPWRSVFKIHLFADTEVTFALTNGGHNAGVVSEPGRARRRHRVLHKDDQEHYLAPDEWLAAAELREGSWWPTWVEWLNARGSGRVPARAPRRAPTPTNLLPENEPLPPAPGDYVRG